MKTLAFPSKEASLQNCVCVCVCVNVHGSGLSFSMRAIQIIHEALEEAVDDRSWVTWRGRPKGERQRDKKEREMWLIGTST